MKEWEFEAEIRRLKRVASNLRKQNKELKIRLK